MEKRYKLLNGDCLDKLKELEENSIDSIVTDPPYGLSFMGKKWDYDVPSQAIWEECIRVLKPGGHLLAFAGSRTYHRMAVRIEDAGFEIRDQIMWVYGSGFPKSHNIGKAVDALEKTGKSNPKALRKTRMGDEYKPTGQIDYKKGRMFSSEIENDITQQTINNDWEGWGTALKPAHEPIVMARKPFKGSVAENVLEWGTGGINVDGCRIGNESRTYDLTMTSGNFETTNGGKNIKSDTKTVEGRFPANFILECTCDNPIVKENTNQPYTYKDKNYSEQGFLPNVNAVAPYNYNDTNSGVAHTDPNCPCYILDEQAPKVGNAFNSKRKQNTRGGGGHTLTREHSEGESNGVFDGLGGASRFFYCPKVSKKERNEGVEGEAKPIKGRDEGQDKTSIAYKVRPTERANIHPTVKPVELMTYLIRLVTPKDGIVLDPFMGSGSTGKAAMREGFQFVGIEREEEYMQIAEQRIDYEYNKRKFF